MLVKTLSAWHFVADTNLVELEHGLLNSIT